MSTELKSIKTKRKNNKLLVTRFFGGTHRGMCLQLTQKNDRTGSFDNVTLTKDQALVAIQRLAQFVNGDV